MLHKAHLRSHLRKFGMSTKCNKCKISKPTELYKLYTTGRIAKSCMPCCEKEQIYRANPNLKQKKQAANRRYYDENIKPNMKAHYQKYKLSFKNASKRAYNLRIKVVDNMA